jgi:site-specific DNA recombinase
MARSSAAPAPAKASNGSADVKTVRCAIYTRKSTEEGLQQEFNSLDAQREASEAFIASQKHEGWQVITDHFDDGGYTGGNMDRPALKRLLAAVEARSVDCIVVYKVDRLSRSLLDFARIIEVFDRNSVSFVAVTQQFNTTSSLGRLTLNILLSFAQFEREIISERTRDKMSAARRKGKWTGGHPVLGYDIDTKGGRIIVNPAEAEQVRTIFGLYMAQGSLLPALQETQRIGLVSKHWTTEDGKVRGGKPFTRGSLHATLTNVLYTGMVDHKGVLYAGEHDRIIDQETWDRVHETLQHNGSTKGATVRNKLGALLRGLLFCVPCGTPMMHTYTMRNSKRYRYYVCYNAQQQGWQNCETKSVSAQAIETAVLDSIRRIGTDPKLAEAVAAEALDQMARRRRDLDQEFDTHRRSLRQSNLALAREAGDTSVDSGARFDRIVGIQKEIETTEHRLTELAAERKSCDQDRINANDLRSTLAEFDSIWSSLTTREQEQMIHLLVAKVGYDGRTGKVTVNFRSAGAKELCQDKHPVITVTTQPEDGAVQVEVAISLRPRRPKASPGAQNAPAAELSGPPRIPRITRLVALAIKFEAMVERGEVRDYADLARLGYVTRARLTQVMNLQLLAPDIQELLLFLPPAQDRRAKIGETVLRPLCAEIDWALQRRAWSQVTRARRDGKQSLQP